MDQSHGYFSLEKDHAPSISLLRRLRQKIGIDGLFVVEFDTHGPAVLLSRGGSRSSLDPFGSFMHCSRSTFSIFSLFNHNAAYGV